MRKEFPSLRLLLVAFIGFCVIGWSMNVYKFANLDFEPSYKAEVIRCISIFVIPAGAIVGYITFEEEE